jgi:peptidyl-Lys metalloendopeptidase
MEAISAKIYSQAHYLLGEGTNLIFELTNHTKKPIHILKWNTPLEGLKSDCLHVLKNGKTIPYDGRLVKRGQPKPKDFLLLQPGTSVSAKVDIGEVYNTANARKMKVNFKPERLVYLREPPTQDFLMSTPTPAAGNKRIKIITKPAVFSLTGNSKGIQTAGEKARSLEKKKKSAKKKIKSPLRQELIPAALPCKTIGGSAGRKSIAKKAHGNGYALAAAVLAGMANNTDYKTWFGSYRKARFNKVKSDYRKIKTEFENKVFTYNMTGGDCEDGDYAYTYKGTTTIWLCSAFWSAPATGSDSQAGTMVHEHSHASAYTDDIAYGVSGCKKLSKTNPGQATRNADSHEYYSKG